MSKPPKETKQWQIWDQQNKRIPQGAFELERDFGFHNERTSFG